MMDDITYMYIGYSIIWGLTFVYLLKITMDQKKLAREMKMLKEVVDGRRKPDSGTNRIAEEKA